MMQRNPPRNRNELPQEVARPRKANRVRAPRRNEPEVNSRPARRVPKRDAPKKPLKRGDSSGGLQQRI